MGGRSHSTRRDPRPAAAAAPCPRWLCAISRSTAPCACATCPPGHRRATSPATTVSRARPSIRCARPAGASVQAWPSPGRSLFDLSVMLPTRSSDCHRVRGVQVDEGRSYFCCTTFILRLTRYRHIQNARTQVANTSFVV